MSFLLFLLASIVFVEAGTELLVKSLIFNSLRVWLNSKNSFIKKVLSCGYCTSVWIAMLPAFFLSCLQTWINPFLAYPLFLLLLHRSSNYLHNINDKYFDKYYSRGVSNEKS